MKKTLNLLVKLSYLGLLGLSANSAFAYYTDQTKIYTDSGEQIAINGINWSGFQDAGFIDEVYGAVPFYALNGKSAVGLIDLLKNPEKFPSLTGVTSANAVSFNTIRLPIAPNTVGNATANTHFRLDLTDPNQPTAGNGVFCASFGKDACLTGMSVGDSLLQVLSEFKKQHIRVLLDIHQTDQGRNGNVQSTDTDNQYLARLLQSVRAKSLDNVIGVDVFNEPHNLDWYRASASQPSWISYIAEVANVVYDNDPSLLLFVEGTTGSIDSTPVCLSQVPTELSACTPQNAKWACLDTQTHCSSGQQAVQFLANWGEDFKPLMKQTSPGAGDGDMAQMDVSRFRSAIENALITERHLDREKATSIADWLLGTKDQPAHAAHLVFSPHVYGQHVASWQTDPNESTARFDNNWGFLLNTGYPVVLGESGYDPNYQSDVDFFEKSLMPYMQKKEIGHNLFYWTFNTNSGDTGGVRQDANTAALVIQKEQDLHDLYMSF
jgi:aryl-phospho-beta-D-glucosidase BglC (GH1 family)